MMNEKRFICGLGFPINSDDPIRIISDSVEDKDYYKFSDICNVLNEQQATINELTKNRDRWRELAKLHNGYFNCLEKAIEKAYEEKPYPKIEDIMDIYSELEKEFEDE